MVDLARTAPAVVVYVAALDAHPDELNCANGILNLRTLELRPHDPGALHTRVTSAGFDPKAEAPFWEATVESALPDVDVRRFVQKLLGSSLLGTYSEHLGVAHGSGSNLKSTMLGAVRDALGDYAIQASADLLVEQQAGSARSDSALASLRGRRLVIASETAEGVPLHDALVKGLTGEHRMRTKFMKQDYFEFDNQSAVWLSTNHKPRTQGSDEAIWRRLVLVPFTYVVPDADRMDPKVVQTKLRGEQDGILRWLVDGLRMFHDDHGKLEQPDAIRAATAAYRRESDPLADWLDDEVSFEDQNAVSTVAYVRSYYEFHCRTTGRTHPIAAVRFNADLERRGARQDRLRINGKLTRVWVGLRLVNQTETQAETPVCDSP
jgi:putative DNA primase/helicase